MNTQSKALQFANELDELQRAEYPNHYEAADEIRRLHSVNAELLMALQYIADQTYDPWTNGAGAQRVAQAAIAKAQQKGQP
jgi:hypothetical protein